MTETISKSPVESALKVLILTKETRAYLEDHDPMALKQSLEALGINQTLADHLILTDHRILKFVKDAMESLDWELEMRQEALEIDPECVRGEEVLNAIAAAENLTGFLVSPEAKALVWQSVIVDLGFLLFGP